VELLANTRVVRQSQSRVRKPAKSESRIPAMTTDTRPEVVTAGIPAGSIVLLLIALLAAGIGFISLSEATMGVGMIAVACLLAIIARIMQATAFHTEIMRRR
jgi:hypothetical protein